MARSSSQTTRYFSFQRFPPLRFETRREQGTVSPALSSGISIGVEARAFEDLKAAVVFGSVAASFTVEDFSVNGLLRAD